MDGPDPAVSGSWCPPLRVASVRFFRRFVAARPCAARPGVPLSPCGGVRGGGPERDAQEVPSAYRIDASWRPATHLTACGGGAPWSPPQPACAPLAACNLEARERTPGRCRATLDFTPT